MSRMTTLNDGNAIAKADGQPRGRASRDRGIQPPRMRLTAMSAMTVEEQRRFEALMESLLTRWMQQIGENKGMS